METTDTQVLVLTPELAAEQKITALEPIKNALDRLSEIDSMVINGIEDKAGYKAVDAARKEFKDIAVMVEGKCKVEREDALKTQKMWVAIEKKLSAPFRNAETALKAKLDAIDTEKQRIADEKAKAEEIRLQGRVKLLIDNGCAFDGFNYSINELSISMPIIREMEDDKFGEFMDRVSGAHAYQLECEEAARLEARTIARKGKCVEAGLVLNEEQTAYIYRTLFFNVTEIETLADAEFNLQIEEYKAAIAAARQAEIDKLKKEQEQLEKDKEEIRNHRLQVRGELCMHAGLIYSQSTKSYDFENKYTSQHIDAAYLETVDSETFTAALESAKAAIITAKEKQAADDAKEAADKKAKEIQDKIDAGIKEAADKAEAARLKKIDDDAKELADCEKQAALAPDKEKLSIFAATIHNIVIPDCNTEEGKKIAEEVRGLLLKVETHIVNKVKAL